MRAILPRWDTLASRLSILTSLCLCILLSACQILPLHTSAAKVSQIVFASPSAPSTFNLVLSQSLFDRITFGLIYDGLLNQNGLTSELEPGLAESLPEISADKQRITFTLKPNLKWSDGEPLTVDDIVFTFQDVYLNPAIPTDIKDTLRVGERQAFPTVKKLDDRRIEFSVPEPYAPFLRNVGGMSILPAHIWRPAVETLDSKGNPLVLTQFGSDAKPSQLVGAGPYRVETYIPNQRIIFRKNPYFWRKDAAGQQQPYIERIVVQIIESTDSQLISFRSNQLDSLEVNPEAFSLLKREEERGRFKIYNSGPDSTTLLVGFNLNQARDSKGNPLVDPIKSKWFTNLAFRQAVAYAIDRETIKTNVFRGLGELIHSPLPSQSPFYFSPDQGLKTYSYDPQRSRQILEQAGFRYNGAGQLLDGQGNPVRFGLLVKSEDAVRVDMAVRVQQDLKAIGIQADLQVLSFNTIIQKLTQRQWDAYVGGFGGGGVEPHSGVNIWSSKGRLHQFNLGPQPGEPQIQGWTVTDWERQIDQLFVAGSRELDDEKRRVIYNKFQQLVQEQLPFIYLVNKLSFEAVRDRIENIKFSALNGAFWNLYELKTTAN
jgi:peptide/nickel transport system substrate-binding protein